MLPRQQRLRRSEEIGTVFRTGKRARHHLVMLVYRPQHLHPDENENQAASRFCFVASKRVGNAVHRNRAKRLLREAARINLENIKPGWDCVLMANRSAPSATLEDIEAAVRGLLRNAGLWVVAT